MPSNIYNFKLANAIDNPAFPRANADNYNENWEKVDSVLSHEFFVGTVSAGATNIVLDEVSASDNRACSWILSLREIVNNKNTYLHINALNDGTETSFIKIQQHINRVDFELNVDLDSGNMRLLITNNESEDIEISGRRLSPFIETNF